jgi:glycosyltransferase involved in cell wall biosynthesis
MLREAIQSVLDQTYSDFEIIVVDDGSTEPINSNLQIKDERIRHIRQENAGPAAARNRGIDLAQGYYIAFLDSDDLFLRTKLQKQVDCMEKHPDVLLSHTSYQRMNIKAQYVAEIRSGTFSGRVYPRIVLDCPIATPTVMIRGKGLGKELRFDENMRAGEDIVFWTKIAKKSLIIGIDEPLSIVRIHGDNIVLDPRAKIIGYTDIIEQTIRRDPDLPYMVRHKALSIGYLNLSYNYLKAGEPSQFLRFTALAFLMYPFSPPFLILRKLLSMCRSKTF